MIGCLTRMTRFYRKPKPETMKKNREFYADVFLSEINWLKDNLSIITNNNKFLLDMYTILITGNRKITPKMADAIKKSIEKCNNIPLYNEMAVVFIRNVLDYVKTNHRITKKQMEALNKVHKRCSENLFKDTDNRDE